MAAPTYPAPLLEPIAADAGGGFITNPIPEAPTGSNAASIQGGFPPETMTSELAGGLPPLGQDMNGFLFMITTHTVWLQSGQLYRFNGTLAADIGGYEAGTILGMTDGSGIWICVTGPNSNDPDAGGAGWQPIFSFGAATVPVTGGAVTLTQAEAKKSVIVLTGVLVGNLSVNLPQWAQEWLIVNATTGAFDTNVYAAAGTGNFVTVPQGGFAAPVGVYSVGDGNLYPSFSPLTVPIDQAPTPLTLVERDNAGRVLATIFNSNTGATNPTVAFVIVDSGNGNFQKISLANFLKQTVTGSVGANGWRLNPDGTISQWGSFAFTSAGGNIAVNFPRAFPTNVFNVNVGVPIAPSGLGGAGSYQASQYQAPSLSQLFYRSVSSSNLGITVTWTAEGN